MRFSDIKAQPSGHETDPILDLTDDHRAILLKLELIERSLRSVQKLSRMIRVERIKEDQPLLKELATAIARDLHPHFRLEEEILFPVLAEYTGREHGPIGVMVHEHRAIEKAHVLWRTSMEHLYGPPFDAGRTDPFLQDGLAMIQLIRQHIQKEEEVLFKICETTLTTDEKGAIKAGIERLAKEMAERDTN